jgi:hypothetical protein
MVLCGAVPFFFKKTRVKIKGSKRHNKKLKLVMLKFVALNVSKLQHQQLQIQR